MWKPWTQAEVEQLVADESIQLKESERQTLLDFRQLAAQVAWKRGAGFGQDELDHDSIWILARSEREILFFDSVEEEFGVGRLTEDRQLTDYGTYGEKLAWALRHFPSTD